MVINHLLNGMILQVVPRYTGIPFIVYNDFFVQPKVPTLLGRRDLEGPTFSAYARKGQWRIPTDITYEFTISKSTGSHVTSMHIPRLQQNKQQPWNFVGEWMDVVFYYSQRYNIHLGVSKNRGTPKSYILIGFSITNHLFWGTPIFGNTHLSVYSPGSPSRPLKKWMFTKSTILFSREFESSKIVDCYSKSRWLTSRIVYTSGECL